MSGQFEKFTERAQRVLKLAQEEATLFNHNYIGTEHLLLGLVREGNGVAARVLTDMGVQLDKVRASTEFIIGRGESVILGEIGLTPRSKKVIELSVDEARRLNHHYIGTEHLLLALIREGEGIAAGVLESLGINLEKTRVNVLRIVRNSHTPHEVVSPTLEVSEFMDQMSQIPLLDILLVDRERIPLHDLSVAHTESIMPVKRTKTQPVSWNVEAAKQFVRIVSLHHRETAGVCPSDEEIFLMGRGKIVPTDHVETLCPLCNMLYEGVRKTSLTASTRHETSEESGADSTISEPSQPEEQVQVKKAKPRTRRPRKKADPDVQENSEVSEM